MATAESAQACALVASASRRFYVHLGSFGFLVAAQPSMFGEVADALAISGASRALDQAVQDWAMLSPSGVDPALAESAQTLHAQAAPKAYVVAQNVVKDEAGYMKDFAPSMSKAIEAAGGKYLVRGGKTISMHGAAPTSRVVILQFDSVFRRIASICFTQAPAC